MPRYVDIEPYDDYKIVAHNEDNGFKCADLPTADVAPVKHAYWRDDRDYCGEFVCSNCMEGNINNRYTYCPWCGAKMDLNP